MRAWTDERVERSMYGGGMKGGWEVGKEGRWVDVGCCLDGWKSRWIFGFTDSWVKSTVNNYDKDHLRPLWK